MNSSLAVLVVVGLIALRFAVPLALASLLCYGLNRWCQPVEEV